MHRHHVLTYQPQATRIKLEVCSTTGAEGAIEEAGHETVCKYVGLDVHKEAIAVAVAEANGGELRFVGEIVNTSEALQKLVGQLRKGGAQLSFCYEAGPCGYGIYRQLSQQGLDCQAVAPSLIPRKAGDRVKTDRRDALSLARLHRAGELTAVWVPDGAQEALRDLTLTREDIKHLLLQSKQQLLAFLLRYRLAL